MDAGPAVVIFSSSGSSGNFHALNSSLTSWKDGPVRVPTFAKRGRPVKRADGSALKQVSVEHHEQESLAHPPSQRFEFVAATRGLRHVDAQTRKTIRSHAMLDYRRQERERKRDTGGLGLEQRQLLQRMKPSMVPPGFDSLDPFDTLPIKMQPYIRELLHFYTSSVSHSLYSIEKHTSFNPTTEYWLPLAFHDSALLNAILACADAFGAVETGLKERPTAVIHLKESIRIVNERLQQSTTNLSDATIAVIATLAIMEKVSGNADNWNVHMRGLKQIVRAKGGLEGFRSNRLVHSKIRRADLCGSVDTLEMPYFPEDHNHLLPTRKTNNMNSRFQALNEAFALDRALQSIMISVTKATDTLNLLHVRKKTTDPLALREHFTSLQYALLSTPSNPTPRCVLQEVCRIGILLYITSILNELPVGASVCDTLIAKLESALERIDTARNETITLEFQLWLMFLSNALATTPQNKEWTRTSFRDAMARLGIKRWDEATRVLKSFCWIEAVHGEYFRALCDR